jgi:hypothetical protein
MPAFRRPLDAGPHAMDQLCLRFGGFCRYTKILEAMAAGIASGEIRVPKPSFSTGGVGDPGSRSNTTSWSKGLPHKSDVLGLTQKLSARADARRRLGR